MTYTDKELIELIAWVAFDGFIAGVIVFLFGYIVGRGSKGR